MVLEAGSPTVSPLFSQVGGEGSADGGAGGVSGGIWMNSDITDENMSWVQVESGLPNFAISAMDYDPMDEFGLFESHVLPCLTSVNGLENTGS